VLVEGGNTSRLEKPGLGPRVGDPVRACSPCSSLQFPSAEVRRHQTAVQPHAHHPTRTLAQVPSLLLLIHSRLPTRANQPNSALFNTKPHKHASTVSMSRRLVTIAGVTAVGGGAYYLYSAGGDPKLAEKQFERTLSLGMFTIFHTDCI
jgi:hypothetical protein